MYPARTGLTPDQQQHFLDHGFVVVENAIDRDFLEEHVQRGWVRLGIDEHDPSTWTRKHHNLPYLTRFRFDEYAPTAWDAICEAVGGDNRLIEPRAFGDNLIIILHDEARPWLPPTSPTGLGWHKDGSTFRHYLDSPEQAVLLIILWRDIAPTGGGTFFIPDSVGHLADLLVEHPEGLDPSAIDYRMLLSKCEDYRELTGRAGDVVIMHPFMLHTSSRNALMAPRIITNQSLHLGAPMSFNRPNGDHSLVEQVIINRLGNRARDYSPYGNRALQGADLAHRQEGIAKEKRRAKEQTARLMAAGML